MAALLVEAQHLLVDKGVRTLWCCLDESEQIELLKWVNSARSAWGRGRRSRRAISRIRSGTVTRRSHRLGLGDFVLEAIADFLFSW